MKTKQQYLEPQLGFSPEEINDLIEENTFLKNLLLKQTRKLKKLQEKEKKIVRENKEKTSFIKDAALNIQMPLHLINQFSHIGLQRARRKQMKLAGDYLSEIQLISEELIVYLHDIIEITALKSGKKKMQLEDIEIAEFLRSIKRQFQPIADNKNVSFSLSLENTYPYVMADYNKFSKVITTLLRQSFRFIEEKGLVKVSTTQDGPNTKILIYDNGSLITQDKKKNLFKTYQKDLLNVNEGRVANFGLSVCKELMVKQRGDIFFEEPEDEKMTNGFVLTLPSANPII